MKIGFISYLYPTIRVSGGGLYAYYLAKELNKHANVDIIIPKEGISKNNSYYEPTFNYIRVPTLDLPLISSLSFERNVKKNIENNYDIIHCNNNGGLFLESVDVFTCHHIPKSLKIAPHFFLQYLTMRKSKLIITVSNQTKKMILDNFSIDSSRVKVVPNGINPTFLEKFSEEEIQETKNKYNLIGKKTGLYVNSNFSPRKNIPLMLETAKYLKNNISDFKLVVVCKRKHYSEVKAELTKFGILDITIIVSNLSDDELVKLYYACDLLIMPSFREGFGFPLIEALATGTPFVSFDVGVASELVKKGYGIIANFRNPKNFAMKIQEFFEMEENEMKKVEKKSN